MTRQVNSLPADVAAVYTSTNPGPVVTAWGEEVDLRNISLDKANELFRKGCSLLKLKRVRKSKKS